MSGTISWATKKHDESKAKVAEIEANLVKLKNEKAKFLQEKIGEGNCFDSFFAGDKYKDLLANASTKDEATKMLDKLASMIRSIEPPAPTGEHSSNGLSVDIPVEDISEDMDLEAVDDAVHDALAEAQAAAAKAGKELSTDESNTI